MGVDEQREEREVLASIYPDEITGRFILQRNLIIQVAKLLVQIYPTMNSGYRQYSIYPTRRTRSQNLVRTFFLKWMIYIYSPNVR